MKITTIRKSVDHSCHRGIRSLCSVLPIVAALGCGADDPSFDAPTTGEEALVPVGWTNIGQFGGSGTPGFLQLLMDGSVLVQDTASSAWYRYIPDPVNGYAQGTWVAAGATHYRRVAFVAGMLRDGRFFVGGGEYVQTADGTDLNEHTHCEIYNPFTNLWSDTPDYPYNGRSYLADGLTAPLPDGTLLVGAPDGDSGVFDPSKCPFDGSPCSAGAWSTPEQIHGWPWFGEGTFTHLQNGKVFLSQQYYRTDVNMRVSGAAVYNWNGPSPKWTVYPHGDLQGPAHDPFNAAIPGGEGASALMLYSGKVFITSGSGFNAIYDPAPSNHDPVQNVATTPGQQNMAENNQAVMPTGNALCIVNSPTFTGNFTFYEYRPASDAFVAVPSGGPVYTGGNVLQTPLPDGTVMVANASTRDFYVYRPSGSQLTTFGRPAITRITGPIDTTIGGVLVRSVYTLTGTMLNGLTNGANRDDEGHNYTSFPIVALTRNGRTVYGTVRDVTTTALVPVGSTDPRTAVSTVRFTLPANAPSGNLTVSVSASGLRSSNTGTIRR